MRFRALVVGDGRLQGFVFAAALIWAVILLVLATGARGESAVRPEVDDDPEGAPYVAGELLVAYEQGTPEETETAVVRHSGARTLKDLPGETRLVSFPEITHQASEATRERALVRELQDLRQSASVAAADYNYIRTASFMPNDPRLDGEPPNQWGLTKTRFPGAWNDSKGGGAKVAIVDSGLSTGHPDIGKISAQKDFVQGDTRADDDYGHGTRVAGIAGALTNNGKGVAGACFRCSLLIAKVMNGNGKATDARIIKGIEWSLDHRADVVNLSLGGPANSDILRRKVNRAWARGAVVVAAAGNEGTSQWPTRRQYPAAYEKAIAVSATNRSDGLAYFSSRGDWVDLAAPGKGILSTRKPVGYGPDSGTSFSAPFVSGLAGLLASQGKGAYAIRQRMQDTAVDLGAAGDDPRFGHGRINADNAVR
jgi:thermitase